MDDGLKISDFYAASSLKAVADRLDDEGWPEWEGRLKTSGNLDHIEDYSAPFIWSGLCNEGLFEVEMHEALIKFKDEIAPVLDFVYANFVFDSVISKMILCKLKSKRVLEPHFFGSCIFGVRRIIVPVEVNRKSTMVAGDKIVRLEAGNAYEINTQALFGLGNMGDTDQVHFIFDFVPEDRISDIRTNKRGSV
jgi:hypothetical protein